MHAIPDCLHITVTKELMKSTDIMEIFNQNRRFQVLSEYFTYKMYDYKETGTHQ